MGKAKTKLKIDFVNHWNEKTSAFWQMVPTPYADRWASLMLEWKKSWEGHRPTWDDKWFIALTQQDYEEILSEIQVTVTRVNDLGKYHLGDTQIDANISQQELNRLHEAFHAFIERPQKNFSDLKEKETEDLCHQLNHLIHLAEGAAYNRQAKNPSLTIIATPKKHMHMDYEEQDFFASQVTRLAGWIYVGYATPGKSLYQCYLDNDLSVVKNKMVRQSQGLSNELHIQLTGEKFLNQNYEHEVKHKFYEWCRKNLVDRMGINFYEPRYYPGRIPLAEPLEDPNRLIQFFRGKKGEITDLEFSF